MKKHRFRNKIKSIFGSHIDPEKDEELKGSNIEMEDNYKKIIELLQEEDTDDRNKLIGLIEDFHKHHQSIYERYDHFTGELRAKVHSKKDNNSSSSSSSDSDSDDSSHKKGSKNGKLKASDILKEELQAANTEINELTRKLAISTEEKEALRSEFQAALNKEQETEKMLGELKLEVDRLQEEKSKLSIELSDEINLKHDKIRELATECSQLREKLAEKEKELLSQTAMHTFHKRETEIKVRGFEEEIGSLHSRKIEIEKQKEDELLTLTKKYEDKERESLSQIENLTDDVSNLQKELESFRIQKSELEEHVQDLLVKVNDKQEEIASLCSQKLESESQLEKSSQEISGFLIQIDSLKQEVAGRMADERKFLEEKEAYVGQVKDLEEELKLLHNLKTESETEVSRKSQEIAEYLTQIQNFREEVEKLTLNQEKTVEEKEGYESKIKDLELKLESLNNLKDESEMQIEKKGHEISELLIIGQSLKEELEMKSKEQSKTVEEKEGYLSKVKDLELQLESLSNLKNESEMQVEKKDLEIAELVTLTQSLKQELESKSQDQAKTVEEKEGFESKVKDLELKLESLNNLKDESEVQLEKKGNEISELLILSQSLKEEIESKSKDQAKTIEEKEGFESKVKDLELQLELLNNLKKESEMHIEKKGLELSELTILSGSLKDELESKSKDQEKMAEEKKDLELQIKRSQQEYSERLAEFETQKLELENKIVNQEITLKSLEEVSNKSNEEQKRLETCLQDAELKIKEMAEEVQKITQSKEQTVEQLEEAIEDLKGDLEIKADEVATLTENVRNLEVKIRLTNQKLRVTEQTLNEKEDDHAGKEEKLHQENKSLIDKISTLSKTIACYKESEESVKKNISLKVNEISAGIDSLSVKFEEDHGHILTQIYEIMNEIQVAKISIKTVSSEKDDVKEKMAKMVIRMKEIESEREKLEQKTTEKDEKIKELENQLHVKDEGLLDLGEEKREAIRQLCLLVDYQRDRYDHLHELLSRKIAR